MQSKLDLEKCLCVLATMYVPNLISRGRKPNRQASTWQTALHVPGKELHAITLSLHPCQARMGNPIPPCQLFSRPIFFTPPHVRPIQRPVQTVGYASVLLQRSLCGPEKRDCIAEEAPSRSLNGRTRRSP